jgi:hypothetical protein
MCLLSFGLQRWRDLTLTDSQPTPSLTADNLEEEVIRLEGLPTLPGTQMNLKRKLVNMFQI